MKLLKCLVQIPVLQLNMCLSSFLNLSVSWLPHLKNNSTHFSGLL